MSKQSCLLGMQRGWSFRRHCCSENSLPVLVNCLFSMSYQMVAHDYQFINDPWLSLIIDQLVMCGKHLELLQMNVVEL